MFEVVNRSAGLRELQIAKALVSLRWIGILLIFSFSYIAKHSWNLSFSIIPIYFIVLFEALLNVFFTCHISLLSRQIFISKGLAGIKRLLIFLFYRLHKDIIQNGIFVLLRIPVFTLKLSSAIGLFFLESLKSIRFNFLLLENVLHTQIFFDIFLLLLVIRFTGTAESPFIYLLFIPIIVAGAVMGYKTAFIYASLVALSYLALCLSINVKLLRHIKFYGPHIGDLSISTEWSYSSFIILYSTLIGTAYFSSHLTKMFKERIFYLFQLLEQNRVEAESNQMLSKFPHYTWFLLNENFEIVRYNLGIFKSKQNNFYGQKISEHLPSLEHLGFSNILLHSLSSFKKHSLEKIRIKAKDSNSLENDDKNENDLIVNIHIIPQLLGSTKTPHALVIFEDVTKIIQQEIKIKEMTNTINHYKLEIEKLSLENKELNQSLCQTYNQYEITNKQIIELTEHIKKLEQENKNLKQEKEEIARENIANKIELQHAKSELKLKIKTIEEIYEYIKYSSNFENFINLFEKTLKQEFQLDFVSVQLFRSQNIELIIDEIYNSNRNPPKVIEFLKHNRNIIESIITEQKPHIIEFDSNYNTTNITISKRKYNDYYGLLPLVNDKMVLGIAICEKSIPNNESEEIFNSISKYLNHISLILKPLVKIRDQDSDIKLLQDKNTELSSLLFSIFEIVKISFSSNSENSINNFVKLISKVCKCDEVLMFRYYNDGTSSILARYKKADIENSKIDVFIDEVYQSLIEDYSKPIKTKNKYNNEQFVYAYPLFQGTKFIGGLIIALQYQNDFLMNFLDIVAKLASENLSLVVLNEEKEIWENFYKEHLSA